MYRIMDKDRQTYLGKSPDGTADDLSRFVPRNFAAQFAEYANVVTIARKLKAMGVNVGLFDGGGNEVKFDVAAAAPVNENINWIDTNGVPVLWRFKIERLPDGRYSTPEFYDQPTDRKHRVAGATPQEVFERLLIAHPVYLRYINTLPTVEPPAPVEPPIERAEIPGYPRKHLRPGDSQYVNGLPPRDLSTPTAQQVSESYDAWFDKSSSVEIKQRIARDPAFAKWMSRDAQWVNPR